MLILPTDDVEGIPRGALGMDAETRTDAVTYALANCHTRDNVTRIEQFLHAALERARAREQPADWIRDALARCAERHTELAAEGGEARGAHSLHSPMEN